MAINKKRLPKQEKPLEEKNFIQERYKQDPFPLWASIIAFLLIALAIYLFSAWMDRNIEEVGPTTNQSSVEETNPDS
jgi:hypothetical protein